MALPGFTTAKMTGDKEDNYIMTYPSISNEYSGYIYPAINGSSSSRRRCRSGCREDYQDCLDQCEDVIQF